MNFHILFAFGLYFSVLISIALFFYKRSNSASNYIGANKSLNYWVTAIAAQSSDMSSWLFMGLPGILYMSGLIEIWEVLGLIVFNYLNWRFVAQKLRTETEKENSQTFSDFFEKKFGGNLGTIRMVTAIISIVFFVCYIAAGLCAVGKLFESVFGLSYHIGMLTGLAITVSYLLIGGLVAVAWCDLFQGLFLLMMIGIVPIIAYFKIGGWQIIQNAAILRNVPLTLFPKSKSIFDIFCLFAGFGLGYFGQLHILVNFIGIKDAKKIKFARYVGVTWQILALTAAVLVGLIGIAYFPQGLANPELVFVAMVNKLFSPFSAGFILCAIFAATVAVLDSQILVIASTFTQDLYKHFFNKKASNKNLVWTFRFATILLPLISFAIASGDRSTIYSMVKYAWSGLGSSFGPLMIMSLYGKNINVHGALSGILSGAIVSGFWPLLQTNVPSIIPGFFVSLASIFIISGITKK